MQNLISAREQIENGWFIPGDLLQKNAHDGNFPAISGFIIIIHRQKAGSIYEK